MVGEGSCPAANGNDVDKTRKAATIQRKRRRSMMFILYPARRCSSFSPHAHSPDRTGLAGGGGGGGATSTNSGSASGSFSFRDLRCRRRSKRNWISTPITTSEAKAQLSNGPFFRVHSTLFTI